jgi:hypothetical protein
LSTACKRSSRRCFTSRGKSGSDAAGVPGLGL